MKLFSSILIAGTIFCSMIAQAESYGEFLAATAEAAQLNVLIWPQGKNLQQVRKAVIQETIDLEGDSYVWDSSGPNAFDCSGFVYYVLKTVLGTQAFPLKYSLDEIPGSYGAQSAYYRDQLQKAGAQINCSRAEVADIVFFPRTKSAPTNHIGFISHRSPDKFIAAQNQKVGVAETSFDKGSYWASRQPVCYHNIWIDKSLGLQ
jgi:cell wall-associated NlpC family hydrolase